VPLLLKVERISANPENINEHEVKKDLKEKWVNMKSEASRDNIRSSRACADPGRVYDQRLHQKDSLLSPLCGAGVKMGAKMNKAANNIKSCK